jgi:hypothetical protein
MPVLLVMLHSKNDALRICPLDRLVTLKWVYTLSNLRNASSFSCFQMSFKFTSVQLFRELSHIAPGTHGWIFAVSAKMEHDLLNSESYPFWLTYSDGDHTPTVSYGRYRAIRWFEADMAGPEFLQLDGKVIDYPLIATRGSSTCRFGNFSSRVSRVPLLARRSSTKLCRP